MEELLKQLMQQHGQQAVVDNPQVPNEHNDAVIQDVMSNIMGGLQNHAGAGDILSGLLGGGQQQNTSAGGGLGSILGSVLGGGNQPQNNTGGGLGSILGSVLGGGNQQQNNAGGGLGSILGSVLGGGNNNDNPIMGAIQQQVIGSLMAKFGLSNQAAGGVASGMVTQVLSGLMNHHNEQPVQQQKEDPSSGLGGLLGNIFGK